MNGERRDGLDPMLDAALRDYSNPEPRAGFEQRMLGRIQSNPPVRLPLWPIAWWLVPVSVAAIVLYMITVGRHRPKVQPLPPVAQVTSSPALPPVPMIATAPPRRTKPPKRERLPAPETLTAGEKALLQFARSNPEQARELVADSGQMKELTIDPLKIEALP